MIECEKEKNKTLSCSVGEELYWRFKQVQAARQESTNVALLHAIQLYLDLDILEEINTVKDGE